MTDSTTEAATFGRLFHLPASFVDVPVSDCGVPLPEGTDPAEPDPAVVNRVAWSLPLSRELARMYGLVPSTPEEVQRDAERAAEFEAECAAAWGAYDLLCEALATVTDPALRAVLDLHGHNPEANVHTFVCTGCDTDGLDAEPPPWPCRTVTTVAAVVFPGVPVPPSWLLTRQWDSQTQTWGRP